MYRSKLIILAAVFAAGSAAKVEASPYAWLNIGNLVIANKISHSQKSNSYLASTFKTALVQAQQSPVKPEVGFNPQVELAGEGIATLDLGKEGIFGGRGIGSQCQINFSDSMLAVGVSERMYDNSIGSFVIGALTTDDDSNAMGGNPQVFLHQAFMDYQALGYEGYLGRTDNPANQLIEFPTLRDDDLVNYTSVTNPFSNGNNLEEHRFSNVAAIVLNQKLHQFINLHVQDQIDSAGTAESGGLNSYGVTYQYLGNPALTSIERVPNWGLGVEYRALKDSAGGSSTVVYGGGVFNLRPSVTNRLDLRLLAQASFGNNTSVLGTLNDTYRANQEAVAISLRSLYSPFGKPSSQLALTAGLRKYSDIGDANSYSIALSFAKSLGAGFDFVSQLGYERRSGAMAIAYGGKRDATVLQVGLSFNFDSIFNQQVGPRRSITNLMHKYIPN